MGTISSVSKEIKHYKKNDSLDESSEYESKTLNSSKNINKINQSQMQSETRENTKEANLNEQKISCKFEWKEGGSDVKIAGAFLENWTKKVDMSKNLSTGDYEIILNIPKGIHQFKFIVDNQWVCSKYYKIINDSNNNMNNIIDTNNIPSQMIVNNNNNSIIKKKKKKEHIEYNCNFPNSNEINVEAPGLPMHYGPFFNLNYQTKQDLMKDYFKKNLYFNKTKTILENNTLKTIITISHEKLSHICFNIENNNNNDNFIRTAITQRNKHKFLTLVYFSPKK